MTIEDILKELPSELILIACRMTKNGIETKNKCFDHKILIPDEILRQDVFSIEAVMARENDTYRPCLAIRYFVDYNENEIKLYSAKNVLKIEDYYVEDMLINEVKDNRERDEDDDLYGLTGGERFLEELYNDMNEE